MYRVHHVEDRKLFLQDLQGVMVEGEKGYFERGWWERGSRRIRVVFLGNEERKRVCESVCESVCDECDGEVEEV